MDRYRTASQEAWATFLRSRFETYARAGFEDAAIKRADLADMELKVMEKRVVFARQQRNKVMGACRLPPEVLSAVFKHAQEGWSPELRSVDGNIVDGQVRDVRATYVFGWMCLVHVCSFWRQTALGSPTLWSSIPCMDVHPDSVPTLLARSRGLPLSLTINGASISLEDDDVLQAGFSGLWLCKPVLRRTKSLTLDHVPDRQLHQWLSSLRFPMPLLETFMINNPRREEREILATLPTNLFAQHAPALRNVSTTATNLSNDWKNVLFSRHLVHLSIELDERTPWDSLVASAPTLRTFYAAIASMKGLQLLTLRDVFPILPQEGDLPAIAANIELPSLHEVRFTASVERLEGCLDLFQRLSIPAHTGVALDLDAEGEFNFDDRLPAPIVKLFGCTEATSTSTIYLGQLAIGLAPSAHPFSPALLRTPVQDWLGPDWKQDRLGVGARRIRIRHWDADYTIFPHVPLLPLQTMQTIIFASDFSDEALVMEPGGWIDAFATAQDVRSISIHYFDALVLFDALSEVDVDSSDSMSLFPRLSTIALHAHMQPKHPDKTLAEMRTSLDVLLLDVLQVRKEKGAQIEALLVSRVLADWDVWSRAEDLARIEFF